MVLATIVLTGLYIHNKIAANCIYGDGAGQGSLACYSPWGRKESDTLSD